MSTQWTRRCWLAALALLALALALWAAPPAASDPLRNWRISFEVLSSLHAHPPEGRKATYDQKDHLARSALAEIVPHVWTNLGPFATRARSRVRAGGYHDQVNPAIHSVVTTSEIEARRLAAALGFVFRQYAVLVYDLNAEGGTLRYVSVRFARRSLSPALAERFFARARAQLKSDKLGFSATSSRMIFINLGTGIPDPEFAAGLRRAATDLPQINVVVEPSKPVKASLIENDWEKFKSGEAYAKLLGPEGERILPALQQLRRRHDGRVRRWAQLLR
jgi:hypothetical protein